MSFCVLFVCKCVLYYSHRVATQLQLTNISYHDFTLQPLRDMDVTRFINYMIPNFFLRTSRMQCQLQYTSIHFTADYCYHLLINSNKSPTRCNKFPVYYPDVYLQLNMFRALSRPSSGAQWLQWQTLVLPIFIRDIVF